MIRQLIDLYKEESNKALLSISSDDIERLYNIIIDAYRYDKVIFACGNGGNAACVQNLVSDLNIHPFVSENKSERQGKRNKFHAVSLSSESTTITALGNDIGFENIYSEQLKYQANENDILFATSGSGTSKNIIKAIHTANDLKMKIILFTRNQNELEIQKNCDLVLKVKGTSKFPGNTGGNNNNFHFEDCIFKVTHIITGLLKQYVQNEENKS